MTWTDKLAGSTLTAAIINELASYATETYAVKVADTSRNTTATPSADPELAIVLLANRTYIWGVDAYVTSAANAAGDFRIRMAWTNTASLYYRSAGLDQSLASSVTGTWNGAGGAVDTTSPSAEATFGASTTQSNLRFFGEITVGGSNSTLTVEWAQSVSNASNTSLLIGSRLWARRVA